MPWLHAGLPDVGSAGASRQQPFQFLRLVPISGVDIDVQTQLAGLGLVSAVEDDRGLQAAETNPGRPDLYIVAVTLQFDITQYGTPEPRQQFRIPRVQDQFRDARGHPLTISAHAAGKSVRHASRAPCVSEVSVAEPGESCAPGDLEINHSLRDRTDVRESRHPCRQVKVMAYR
jgi:hypothetical protein